MSPLDSENANKLHTHQKATAYIAFELFSHIVKLDTPTEFVSNYKRAIRKVA
jgi:hypothetical protein